MRLLFKTARRKTVAATNVTKLTAVVAAAFAFAAPGTAVFAQNVATPSAVNVANAAGIAPDAMIKNLADSILTTVKSDPQIKAGNVGRITQVVNQQLLPYTDFRRTTRLALGRFWRQASPQQQDEIVKQFELLLIHTYAGATAKVGDQTVDVKPLHADPQQTDVVVRTNVVSQGQQYPVDYRLEKTPEGWKIYDVNVLGAWLIEAYRQQFAAQIQQNGIDGLLTFLTQRNQQLAAANSAGREDGAKPVN